MPQLRLDGVSVRYGAVTALSDVSMVVEPAQVTVILGANGAGKSSLISVVSGLVPCASGTISLDDVPIHGLPPERRVRMGIALSPEGRRVFEDMTVAENLSIGGFAHRKERKERAERVYEYFPTIADRRAQAAGTLSGGQQQMLAIGRALMAVPRLLLLDEPSLGLAPVVLEEIAHIIRRLVQEEGITVLLSEQNAALGLDIAQNAYILQMGRITRSGPSEELRNEGALREAYLGA